MQKVVILEVNEVPLRIFKHYAALNPSSCVAKVLAESMVLETMADDVEESFLYPSQTWASLNTGAAYDQHNVHWYNDPKPERYPLYWAKVLDAGYSVGLVNTLHSSPAESLVAEKNLKFVIPDCFASSNLTKPSVYSGFQGLNLAATAQNGRVATLNLPFRKIVKEAVNTSRIGISPKTLLYTSALLPKIKLGRANKERLRNVQFLCLADIFVKELKTQTVDLSVFFTNHIAGNMHRYWYALFPNDYSVTLFSDEWVKKYADEIMIALSQFDHFLDRIVRFCKDQDRILVMSSSMGQQANLSLTEVAPYAYRLDDIHKLLTVLVPFEIKYELCSAMIPQYGLRFGSKAEAQLVFDTLDKFEDSDSIDLEVDLNNDTITVTVGIHADVVASPTLQQPLSYEALGFTRFAVDDAHTGKHSPSGSLIVFNSRTSQAQSAQVSYLEYAPAILNHFKVALPDYMRPASFSL
jgi:hypothetical protein